MVRDVGTCIILAFSKKDAVPLDRISKKEKDVHEQD